MTPNSPHEVESIALGYVRCTCKNFEFRIENYKGKTEEDMAIETGYAFERHKAESLGR